MVIFYALLIEFDYAYDLIDNLSLSYNGFSILLLIPSLISIYIIYNVTKYRIVYSTSLMVIFPFIVGLLHYFSGKLGANIDFISIHGVIEYTKMYFIVSIILFTIGIVIGMLLLKIKGKG